MMCVCGCEHVRPTTKQPSSQPAQHVARGESRPNPSQTQPVSAMRMRAFRTPAGAPSIPAVFLSSARPRKQEGAHSRTPHTKGASDFRFCLLEHISGHLTKINGWDLVLNPTHEIFLYGGVLRAGRPLGSLAFLVLPPSRQRLYVTSILACGT